MSEIKTKKFSYRKNKFDNNRRDKVSEFKKQVVDVNGCNTQKTTEDSDYEQRRVNGLLHVLFKICELSGFWVEERIVLKDRKTGKIWR